MTGAADGEWDGYGRECEDGDWSGDEDGDGDEKPTGAVTATGTDGSGGGCSGMPEALTETGPVAGPGVEAGPGRVAVRPSQVRSGPFTSGGRRAASGEREEAKGRQRAARGERQAASGERREARGERPAASGEQRVAMG